MAFRHVTAVIESWLPAAEKLVALALAESASKEDDCCWLALATIAQRASCTRRGAQRILLRLQAQGIVEAAGRRRVPRGYVNIFRIKIDQLPTDQPENLTDDPESPVEEIDAVARATPRSAEGHQVTGDRGSPLATGDRKDPWGDLGSRVRATQSALTGDPGSPNPIRKNQVSEPVHGRAAPGSGPGRPSMTPNPELSAEERAARSAAHRLGIEQRRSGETLDAFNARIGQAQLDEFERRRLELEADVPRGTSHAEPAPLSHSGVEQVA